MSRFPFAAEAVHRVSGRIRRDTAATLAGLCDVRRPRLGGFIPMFWFRDNFGDTLSPDIVRWATGLKPVRAARSQTGKLLATGSVIHVARASDVVWGSGAVAERRIDGRGVEFLAVRGPHTRRLIAGDVPEVYGDPAMLLPMMYRPRRLHKRFDVGLVPHYVDNDTLTLDDPAVANINVRTNRWRDVVDEIVACDIVVSSSLHGIIVAEAYGVPAVWVQPSRRIEGGRFKFRDYYASTHRDVEPARWDKGLSGVISAPPNLPVFDLEPLLTSLSNFRQGVSGAFR